METEPKRPDISDLIEIPEVDVLEIPATPDMSPMELPLNVRDLGLERLTELVSVVELVVIDMIQKKEPLRAGAIAKRCQMHPVQLQHLVRMHAGLGQLMEDAAMTLAADAEEELERLAHLPERVTVNDKGTESILPNVSAQRIKALEVLLVGRHPSYKRTIDTTVNNTTNIFEKGSRPRIVNVEDARAYFTRLRSGGTR